MGYTEVTVVWEGAVSDEATFVDDSDMQMFIGAAQSDAADTDDLVQIFTLYHDHDMDESDCECIQYATDHHPYWTNEGTDR